MSSKDSIEMNGVVKELLSNMKYKVELENGLNITAHVAGKMRLHYVKITPGDKVKVAISPYDLNQGRIIYREK